LGGLDLRDDGKFHYVWQDDAMQVVYHAATLMPSTESDAQFNKKKRHIGNDYVARKFMKYCGISWTIEVHW
jgi:tuberous sclerosis protein 2